MACGYCGSGADEPHRINCPHKRNQVAPTLPVMGFCTTCAQPLTDASVCHYCGAIQKRADER